MLHYLRGVIITCMALNAYKNDNKIVAGDDPNKTNEKRNFEGCVAAGQIRDYFTGRQKQENHENQR